MTLRSAIQKLLIFTTLALMTVGGAALATIAFIQSRTSATSITTLSSSSNTTTSKSTRVPTLSTSVVLKGLSNPWDLAFLNATTFIYTLRAGEIRGFDTTTGSDWLVAKPSDVYVSGEGGLLGLIADVDFATNHYIYSCMNVAGPKIHVVRWSLATDFKSTTDRQDIITDMPSNPSGRHSGCRLAMSAQGQLWVGTGDTAVGTLPQDPQSLGGKILRVDREGKGVAGNLSEPFDTRIFSYGHRNTQGLVLFPNAVAGVFGYSSEHGSDRDDEVNLLQSGNFGWNPVPGYNEAVDMTDLVKYPNAIPPIWKSGNPTIAVSGMSILQGSAWQAWEGAVMLAVQKDKHVRLLRFDAAHKLIEEKQILNTFGRVRTVVPSLDGSIYLLTDNGGGADMIVRVAAN